jgi:hypothetical protein
VFIHCLSAYTVKKPIKFHVDNGEKNQTSCESEKFFPKTPGSTPF